MCRKIDDPSSFAISKQMIYYIDKEQLLNGPDKTPTIAQ